MKMIRRKSWDQFRKAGLLWWINRQLHLFGWALTVDVDDSGKVIEAYPSKTKFRGFGEKSEEKGFKNLTRHIGRNVKTLLKDAES